MKIISSQHFIDWEIVEEKMEAMKAENVQTLVVPCWDAGEIDGECYAVVSDCHHRMVAARELGIEITFDVDDDPEGLTGEDLLEARYMDGDYYDVETSDPAAEKFYLVF